VSVARNLTRKCTIRYQSSGAPDAHGNPTDFFFDVDTLCQFQQRGRQEIGDMGQLSDTTWLVTFLPNAVPPKAADQLIVDGVTYEFRGDSWPAYTLSGRLDHIEATAARAA
jgi:hypothetical protein